MMIRKCFNEFWAKKVKDAGYKHPLRSYSDDYPIKLLTNNEGNYIVGTIMEIIEDDTAFNNVFDIFFTAIEEPLSKELEAYASSAEKSVDELADHEIHSVIDKIADKGLSTMMGLLQQTQNVPEIIGITMENGAYEDLYNFQKRGSCRSSFWCTLFCLILRFFYFDSISCRKNSKKETSPNAFFCI